MRKIFQFILMLAIALIPAFSQNQVDPTRSIKWPLITITGTNTPAQACTTANYGQPFQRTDVNPNQTGSCGTDGWQYRGSTSVLVGSSLVFAGDSRCALDGNSPPQSWTYVLQSLSQFESRTVAFHNTCVAGRTIEQVQTAYTSEVYIYRPAATGITPTYLFVDVGTNSLADGGEGAATAATNYIAYAHQATLDGFTVIAMTQPQRASGGLGSFTSNNIEAFNSKLRADAYNGDWNTLIDMANALQDPYDLSLFQSDFTHPSYPQGNYFEAQYVNFVFGGPVPGLGIDIFDGRRPNDGSFSCDISGLGSTTTATNNNACGILAGNAITTGSGNTFTGFGAGPVLTTGGFNTLNGALAGRLLVDASDDTCIGYACMDNAVHDSQSTYVGFEAGFNEAYSGATGNVGIGYEVLFNVTTGLNNAATGWGACNDVVTGSSNVCIGSQSGPSSDVSNSISIGPSAHAPANGIQMGSSTYTQFCFGNGMCWFYGSGAPSINCTVGDLYSNTSGGASTTLYVCTATNTWTAK